MRSLRRDLIERRLWPIAVVLLAAIAAVPFLLHSHSSTGATLADAPAAVPVTTGSQGHSSASRKRAPSDSLDVSTSRDPFQAVVATASKSKTNQSSSSSSSSSQTATTPSAGATGSGAAGSSSQGTGTTGPSDAPSNAGSSSTGAGTSPTVTPVVKDPVTGATSRGPWTLYSIDATLSGRGWTQAHDDLTRLSPLPKASFPKVMYLGVVNTGREAVFELGTGVDASGAGTCKPSRKYCDLVMLSKGQTEHLSYLLADGTERSMTLRLTGISSTVTDSAATAVSAFNRQSQVGACELELGSPTDFNYDATSGSLQSATTTNDCRRDMKAVPFPGTGSGL